MSEREDHTDVILYRLDAISETLKSLDTKQDDLLAKQAAHAERISIIEFKSGVFGTLGGIVGVVLTFFVESLRQNFHK